MLNFFHALKFFFFIFLCLLHIMKATSFSQKSTVFSLLEEGYTLHQIESKTGLGKSTVGRIKKEWDGDKENHKGGRPSKLSTRDNQAIIRQITTGQLDNAVQATHFINNINSTPVSAQTVCRMLKKNNFRSVVKSK